MRIEIDRGGHRTWLQKAGLFLVRRYVGTVPGPMLFLSYESTQIPRSMLNYMTRSVAQTGAFNKAERELFAAFVSRLNSCNF
ncbi:MAG: hypothetical protein AAF514_11825 [Verrucomicrobiota bacterium]